MTTTHRFWRLWTPCLVAGAALAALAMLPGCPGAGTPTPTPGDGLTGRIVNLSSNIRLSGDQSFTVVYDADPDATDVDAFFVQVESTDPNAPEIGPEVIFANNIPTGTGQTVNLDTSSLTVGIYRVGLRLANASDSLRVLSTGSLELTELATPTFTLPNQNLTIQPGTAVNIRAELGDPENAVQWRLFYIDANASTGGTPVNELGTEIRTGTTNEAIVTWNTGGVAVGNYRIGISVTDTGLSIDQTVANGQEDRIITAFNEFLVEVVSEPPVPRPPSVVVSQPSSNRNILSTEVVQIAFNVTVFEGPPAEQSITVFFDEDGAVGTGDETTISGNLPITATTAVLSGALLQDRQTVRIGVTADDGKNAPVTTYAAGKITRVRPEDSTLTVTQPNSVLNRRPGDTVNVAWTTTLPTSAAAKYNVRVRRLNSAGQVVSEETNVSTTGLPLTQTTYAYAAIDPGRFKITVEAVFTNGTTPSLRADAPQLVIVSTLPTIRWLGDLVSEEENIARLDGAIFQGVQFEDNAGSAADGGEDFDDDGFDDFILVARFGKPEFVNPTGIGPGEAYLIFGQGTRYAGEYNLNSVSTASLPGTVYTGLQTSPINDTSGINKVFISSDADGDGVGEIIFGFPWAASFPQSDLGGQIPLFPPATCPYNPERPSPDQITPQFHRGGIVIVSSLNGFNTTRTWLDTIGQYFDWSFATPVNGSVCQNDAWMDDKLTYDDGNDCPTALCTSLPAQGIGCVPGADGQYDLLVQPRFGFDGRLADPWLCLNWPGAFGSCPALPCPICDHICDENTSCECNPLNPNTYCQKARPLCEEGIEEYCGTPCTPVEDSDPPEPRCECDEQKEIFAIQLDSMADEDHVGLPLVNTNVRGSAFYPDRTSEILVDNDGNDTTEWNLGSSGTAGARMIGRAIDDGASMSITQSDNDLIVSAPFNADGGAVDDGSQADAGNAYFVRFNTSGGLPKYWYAPATVAPSLLAYSGLPIAPHQYLLGGDSFSDLFDPEKSQSHWDTDHGWPSGVIRVIGVKDELIENVLAVPDFNRDSRSDIAIGAPSADIDNDGTPDGAVYVLFRRTIALEGNYELSKLRRNTNDPERLSGLMVREALGSRQRFGESLAGDFDFNDDGWADLVVGNPDGNGTGASNTNATGEVVIIFGSNNTISQERGIPVETDSGGQGLLARRQGARIRGLEPGSEFGYNVANIGDIDGDGKNDLAIAAPNASPYFDSNISDANDSVDPSVNSAAVRGLDSNLDGIRDDVTGPKGLPDGSIISNTNTDVNDELRRAGLVYIILSSTLATDFAASSTAPMDISINQLGTNKLDGFIIVGRRGERFVDRTATTLVYGGDYLGGGLAGTQDRTIPFNTLTVNYDGNTNKSPVGDRGIPRERSFGLSKAGDVDGDGFDDFILGAQLADPRIDPITGEGTKNAGEAYLIYGFSQN